MATNGHAEASEFAEHDRALVVNGSHAGSWILVHVRNPSTAAVVPAAGFVHRASRVVAFDPRSHFPRVVLPRSLIERHPHDNRRMIAERVDHRLQLAAI